VFRGAIEMSNDRLTIRINQTVWSRIRFYHCDSSHKFNN
jgi:hypothetical protein